MWVVKLYYYVVYTMFKVAIKHCIHGSMPTTSISLCILWAESRHL